MVEMDGLANLGVNLAGHKLNVANHLMEFSNVRVQIGVERGMTG